MTISPSQPIINAVPISGTANCLIKNNNHIPVRVSNIPAGIRRASLGNKTVPSAARGGRRYSWHGENVLNEDGGPETRHIQDSAPSQTHFKPGDFSLMYRQNRLNALYACAGNHKEKLAYLSKNAGNLLVASHLEHIANAHYLAREFGPNEQQRAELDNIMHQLTKLMIKDGLGDNSVFGSYQIDKKGMCEKREKWETELVRKLNEIIGESGEKPGDRLIKEKIRPFIDNLIIQQTGRDRNEVAAKTTQQLINEHAYRGMQNIRSGIEDYKVSDLQKIFHDVEMVLKLPHLLDNEYVKQYPVLPPRPRIDDEQKSDATGDSDPLHNKKTGPDNDRRNSANQPKAPVSFTYAPVTTYAPVYTYAPNIHFPPAAATGSDKGGNVNNDTHQTNVAAGGPHQARVHGPVSPNTANSVGSSMTRVSQVHNSEPLGKGDAKTTQADITTGLIGHRAPVQGNLAQITPSWKTHHHTSSPSEPDMVKVLLDAKAKLKKITPNTGHPTAVTSLNATLVEARRKLRPVYQVQPGLPSADKLVRETARLIENNIANSPAPTLTQPVRPARPSIVSPVPGDRIAEQTHPLISGARSLANTMMEFLNAIPEPALNARKVQAHELISSIPDETSAHNLANRDAAREQVEIELNRLLESLSPPAGPMSQVRAGIPNTDTVDKAPDEKTTKFTSAVRAVADATLRLLETVPASTSTMTKDGSRVRIPEASWRRQAD